MKQITTARVKNVNREMSGMTSSQGSGLVQKMAKNQPYLLAYLATVEKESFSEEERSLLLYLGTLIWYAMNKATRGMKKISEEDIEIAEANNLTLLENLEGNPAASLSSLLQNYNQTHLLTFVEALAQQKERCFRPQTAGLALVHLKTVIDCLDQ